MTATSRAAPARTITGPYGLLMETVGCLPTLKCKSLRTVSAASAKPESTTTVAIPVAHLRTDMIISPLLLFIALIHGQVIQHLLLLVRIDQQLLRVDVVGIISN